MLFALSFYQDTEKEIRKEVDDAIAKAKVRKVHMVAKFKEQFWN